MSGAAPVVLLDMSGVVFVNGTRRLIDALVGETGATPDALAAILSGPDSWALRRGTLTAEAFWRRVEAKLWQATGLAAASVRRRWIDAFVPHPGMMELIADLAGAGMVLGTVAETTAERRADLARRYPHERHLTHTFYSFEHGADKRDGGLFAIAAGSLRPREHAIIMVEDDEASAAAAAALGFATILFAGAATLRAQLARHGDLHDP